ncbi:MAG: hypothetical protein K2P17_04850 [Helicobacteraceae bacterium]|nr:hypothetical protein [Helicobacteraceae bacterium]
MVVFDRVIIIGNGSIAVNILKSLSFLNKRLEAISYKEHNLSFLRILSAKYNIKFNSFVESNLLDYYLNKINNQTLIISANNNYIFKSNLINKKYIKIVNFHNALLPKHKGVNAPIWTIYNQDKISGITWHIVSDKLDSGDIIIQQKIAIKNNITSMQLFKELMDLGFKSFLAIQDDLLKWNVKSHKMQFTKSKMHKFSELPNNGFLNITWGREKMSAFLRSMDAFNIIPKPKIKIQNKNFIINRYFLDSTKYFPFCLYINNITLELNGGGYKPNLAFYLSNLSYFSTKVCA